MLPSGSWEMSSSMMGVGLSWGGRRGRSVVECGAMWGRYDSGVDSMARVRLPKVSAMAPSGLTCQCWLGGVRRSLSFMALLVRWPPRVMTRSKGGVCSQSMWYVLM